MPRRHSKLSPLTADSLLVVGSSKLTIKRVRMTVQISHDGLFTLQQ